MATLPQLTLDFNRQIKLSTMEVYSPQITVNYYLGNSEFREKMGFFHSIDRHLELKDNRRYYVHSNEQLLRQKIYQIIAGYSEDDVAD